MTDAVAIDSPLTESAQVATVLAMPGAAEMSDIDVAEAVESGLPVASVDALATRVNAVENGAVFKVISESTYRRAMRNAQRRLSPEASGKVYDLARVLANTAVLFKDDWDKVALFMSLPNQALGGRKPFDLARSSRAGADAVVRMIGAARAGVAL